MAVCLPYTRSSAILLIQIETSLAEIEIQFIFVHMKFIFNENKLVFLCGSYIQDDCQPPPDKFQNIGLYEKIPKWCPFDKFEKYDHHHVGLCLIYGLIGKWMEQIFKQLNIWNINFVLYVPQMNLYTWWSSSMLYIVDNTFTGLRILFK